ncbi:unnamed protein product [Diatraea saccharalis]|uniref:MADF domain-containing protein n=1 Tax=Diatraea saccharalis TaxID=40085 RepID=A0A9N9WFA2_9NEOP|nr:unnamed protein product [Diatraea saccharalis]
MPKHSDSEDGGGSRNDVGRMVDSSQADDRKMIRLVRERRLLYARNNMPVASYYTRVKALWNEVAQHMGWTVADVRRKWSHIRNSYSRHLRNEMHGARTGKGRMVSRWYLADELEFLREHMATDIRPPSFSNYAPTLVDMEGANGSEHDTTSDSVDIQQSFMANPWFAFSNQASVETKREPYSNDDSCSSAFDPEENNSYFQFFRGIHSDYQELPPRKQRLFRRKCLDFLHELLDEDDVPVSMVYKSDSAMNLTRFSRADSDEERDKTPLCVVEQVVSCTENTK